VLFMSEYDRKKIKAIRNIVAVVLIALILSASIYFAFEKFFNAETHNGYSFSDIAEKYPIAAPVIMLLACALQVIIAFIPGEILEQAAGLFFGPWLGAFICLAGTVSGSVIALLISKKFGRNLVYALYPKEKIDAVSFVKNTRKRNILTFIVFFIPGTPKDLLTYVVGLTDMKVLHYLLLTTIARIPSIIMSTVSGHWISDMFDGNGSVLAVVIWNAASMILCVAGYGVYILIEKGHERRKAEKNVKEK